MRSGERPSTRSVVGGALSVITLVRISATCGRIGINTPTRRVTMEPDLRGLGLEDRKKLIRWYEENSALFEIRAMYRAYKYLEKIRSKDKKFAEIMLLRLLEADDNEDDEPDSDLLPKTPHSMYG